jgi:hypothetical protein
MTTAASIVPGLIGFAVLVALLAGAPWVRRRNWVRFARRNWRHGGTSEQHGMDRGDSPEDLLEYGRWLASWREDLIAQGVDPAELAVPLAPPEEPNTDRGDK